MKKNSVIKLPAGVGVFILFTFILLPAILEKPAAAEATPDCSINTASCTKTVNGRTVELDIHPKPVTALEDLTFQVSISGDAVATTPYIDLNMPGMHMGPNRVKLEQSTAVTYEGQGVIVRCPSGKKIWRATVVLPSIGKAEFTFDVVY